MVPADEDIEQKIREAPVIKERGAYIISTISSGLNATGFSLVADPQIPTPLAENCKTKIFAHPIIRAGIQSFTFQFS